MSKYSFNKSAAEKAAPYSINRGFIIKLSVKEAFPQK